MKFDKKSKFLVPVLLLLVLVIIGSVAGYALGKYRADVVMTGKLTTSSRLVESFKLQATRSGAGTSEEAADEICLLPGTDLEMQFNIAGKTAVRSYLYVEVTGEHDSSMLADGWRRLDGVAGKHGGAVYAYETVLDGSKEDLNVEILRSGLTMDTETDFSELSFCGYLLQITTEAERNSDQARMTFINKFPQG